MRKLIVLDCDKNNMINRMINRSNECNLSNKELRSDDNIEILANRINIFENETIHLVDTLSVKYDIHHINANNSQKYVYDIASNIISDFKHCRDPV